MPNIIPPLLSSTPPPIVDDDEDDEFGDFRAGVDLSFGCDGLSLPSTPEHVQKSRLSEEPLDYNSNNEDQLKIEDKGLQKDFQDIRKPVINLSSTCSAPNGVFSENSTDVENEIDEIKTNDVLKENSLSSEINSSKNGNKASNSSEIELNGEKNLFQDVSSVLNTLNLDKTDLCNSEKNLHCTNSEIKTLEALNIDDYNTTEVLDVRKTSTDTNSSTAENRNHKSDNGFVGFKDQEETDTDLKANMNTSHEVTDEFGDFKDCIESKDEISEPPLSGHDSEFGDFENNVNDNEIVCDNHENFCMFEKSLESAAIETPNCNDDDFGDFSAALDSLNSSNTPPVNANGNFSDFEQDPASLSEKAMFNHDNFGDFEKCTTKSDNHENFCVFEKSIESAAIETPNCDDDDFGDFSAALDSLNSSNTPPVNGNFSDFEQNPASLSEKTVFDHDNFGDFEKCTTKSDDTDEFGDFEGSTVQVKCTLTTLETLNDGEDDFGNFQNRQIEADDSFGDFETNAVISSKVEKCNEDDFGDFEKCSFTSVQAKEPEFGDFDSCFTLQHHAEIDESLSTGKKAEEVITSAFPNVNVEEEEYLHKDISEKDEVFGLLKDIMETNALKFQWVNSSSQKVLLKALNIDIRNILYGPGWNLAVPKFAANLGSNPLEPLKPEILTPEVVPTKPTQQTESVASFPTEVPSVQFDWTSAGLTNPLDSQNDDQQPAGNINLDWNFIESTKSDEWVQKESMASPAHSLNFEVNQDAISLKSDGEFEPQETYHENISPEVVRKDVLSNMVPLRETHIYEENPIKVQEENVDDDFGDFHMSLPVAQKEANFDDFKSVVPNETAAPPSLQCLPTEPLKPVVVHSVASATVQLPAKIEWPEPGITEDDIHSIELTYVKPPTKEIETKQEELPEISKPVLKKPSVEDDDWTDFISHKETTKNSPEKIQNNLQLSVFNLGNIQPIKPPVPVITPHGLLQTKLSSSGTISPLIGSPVHSHRPHQKQLTARPPDGYQPSIISQQFSKQFLDSTTQNYSTPNVSLGNYNLHPSFSHSDSVFVPNANHTTNSSAGDDDDWTDFISSQPVPQQQSLSFTPNIIANPNRYDPLREFRLNGDVLNSGGSRKATQKSSVPSVTTLPDLDFVIAKNRTFTKK